MPTCRTFPPLKLYFSKIVGGYRSGYHEPVVSDKASVGSVLKTLVNNIGACAERTEQNSMMHKPDSAQQFNRKNLWLKKNAPLIKSVVVERGRLFVFVFNFTGLLSLFF